ncbi:tetratricopeptide repeat protein [Paraburkholderia hospita]|uniref:tetratricopeptide repeat protein n=1 Tax=Paraburkholderia hospita TaxID=169430 RepID=UPI000271D753|nr:tetratricopeptide repeat protein [Paraburkholderia hospita]EUC21292.1 Tetratricopeptide TPR_1 repeat-containing protein [Burkholderia sp. BT03]SKC94867.1 Tetratricopeptide repeat-containing protein [Paraburkholderia hospita]
MNDIAQHMNSALEHHRASRFDDARPLYELVLQSEPEHSDALHFLGLLSCQTRNHDEGIRLMERSIAVRPEAMYFNNYGNMLMEVNRVRDAIDSYQHAIRLNALYPDAYNNLGYALCRAKQPEASMRACVNAIKLQPDYADAYNNLGNALQDMSNLDEAAVSYCKAIELKPDHALAFNNLGNVMFAKGDAATAIQCFRKAVELKPDLRDAHHSLGALLREHGDVQAALETLRLALDPKDADSYNTYGCGLRDAGKLKEAEQAFRDALEIDAELAVAHFNLAGVLRENGELDQAEMSFGEAIRIDAEFGQAYRQLGSLLSHAGRHQEALKHCEQAIRIDPESSAAYRMLGEVYTEMKKRPAAILAYRHALELSPEDDAVWCRLASALCEDRQLDEALDSINKAFSLGKPTGAKHVVLGDVLSARGAIEESIEEHIKGLELGIDPMQVYARLLFTMPGSPRYTAFDMREHAVRYGHLVASKAKPFTHAASSYDGSRPLRLGFVSGDLRQHPVGIFLESIMGHLDRTRIEPIAYVTFSDGDDAVTERLKPHFSAWHKMDRMKTEDAARQIHDDKIDILVDLSGHTAFSGLPVFAWRPAPVQVSWLGFFATTGCEFIDYFVGDRFTLPLDEEAQFVEKPWRLPDSYLCFTPPASAPDVGPLPMERNGFVTFGYFGKLVKVTDDVVALWSRLLHRVPGSKLFLKSHGLGADYLQYRTIERFVAHGIGADRLILEGESARFQYFDTYNRVDIMLSPFPYPGGTTTAEGLWMGAPVLSLRGDRFLSHIAESLQQAAGMGEWVAADRDDYLDKAAAFAADPTHLAALRAGLREQVRVSPMCDAPRFAGNLVDAFHQMWAIHLAKQARGRHV